LTSKRNRRPFSLSTKTMSPIGHLVTTYSNPPCFTGAVNSPGCAFSTHGAQCYHWYLVSTYCNTSFFMPIKPPGALESYDSYLMEQKLAKAWDPDLRVCWILESARGQL
jgi:hypothetical protein